MASLARSLLLASALPLVSLASGQTILVNGKEVGE